MACGTVEKSYWIIMLSTMHGSRSHKVSKLSAIHTSMSIETSNNGDSNYSDVQD